ncbi:hypothetical protein [Polaribacter sp. Asnod6-C07]|uniref:hypothetical protein n=1 Tax=Polaribacter sp. Asnod6-C07 TaxID=3160582 RepID=UPI003867C9EA
MKEILINDDLLEEVRLSRNTWKWQDKKVDRIVDIGYTHEYLLANRTVDDVIKEFYKKSFKEMYTVDEWQEFMSLDKNNKSDITNNCSFLIEGALHNRLNLWAKIEILLKCSVQFKLNNKYKYFSDLKPYFETYACGFKSGYNQFINIIVKPHSLFDNSKEEASQIIFRYLTNAQSNDPVVTSNKGFKFRVENGNYDICNDFLDGLNEGCLYRAWTIVFSQSELFLPLFQNYLNGSDKVKIENKELKKGDILKKQNNLIPRVSLQYVYDFFSVLIEPNKKGTFYLNEQKLLIFIESTFINEDPTLQSFNVSFNKDKKDVKSVFRRFYENCFDLEYDKKNLSRKYFDIMNKAFKGFSVDKDLSKWHETNSVIPTKNKPKGKL